MCNQSHVVCHLAPLFPYMRETSLSWKQEFHQKPLGRRNAQIKMRRKQKNRDDEEESTLLGKERR